MTARHGCGAAWDGLRTEHCAVCHQTFSGESTGEAHRVGPFNPPGQRRCRTPDELTALGLWVERNRHETEVWHGSPNKGGEQRRRPAREVAP